jgi:hypothetical protein
MSSALRPKLLPTAQPSRLTLFVPWPNRSTIPSRRNVRAQQDWTNLIGKKGGTEMIGKSSPIGARKPAMGNTLNCRDVPSGGALDCRVSVAVNGAEPV